MKIYKVGELIGIDNNESEFFFFEDEFVEFVNVSFFLVDVCDWDKIFCKMKYMYIVFYMVVFKYVILCEWVLFEVV